MHRLQFFVYLGQELKLIFVFITFNQHCFGRNAVFKTFEVLFAPLENLVHLLLGIINSVVVGECCLISLEHRFHFDWVYQGFDLKAEHIGNFALRHFLDSIDDRKVFLVS